MPCLRSQHTTSCTRYAVTTEENDTCCAKESTRVNTAPTFRRRASFVPYLHSSQRFTQGQCLILWMVVRPFLVHNLRGLYCCHTSFEAAAGSFLIRKKESSPCGPYFPGAFQLSGRCAQTHTVPRVQIAPKLVPTKVCPTTLAPYLNPLGRRSLKPRFQKSLDFSHLLQNSGAHTTAGHGHSRNFHETLRDQGQTQQGFSKHFNYCAASMNGSTA